MNQRLLLILITFQISKEAIPFFKRGKFIQFHESVQTFSAKEIANCEKQMSLFTQIIGQNTALIKGDMARWQLKDNDENSRIISFNEV